MALIAAAALLLLPAALVAGTGTALGCLTHTDLRCLRRGASPRRQSVLDLHQEGDALHAALLMAGAAVALCAVLLAVAGGRMLFGPPMRGALAGAGTSAVALLLGGAISRSLAAASPLRFACFAVPAVAPLLRLFRPLACRALRRGELTEERSPRRRELSLDELADAVDRTQTASHEEKEMLSGIVGFAGTEAVEVMKPRVDITFVSLADGYVRVKETIIRSGFSRIPVCGAGLDDIRGMLYVKDLLPHIDRDDSFAWQRLARRAHFVPGNRKISDLLEDFRNEKVHVAVVVDEYGSTLGLVSLEDVIEEIVGEITDESDAEAPLYERLDDRTYLFDGKIHLGDFERVLGLDEELLAGVRGEAETLGGLMLELRGGFPAAGERFGAHGLRFTVERLDGRRVARVRVELTEQDEKKHDGD